MQPEQPFQRNYPTHLAPETFVIFELGQTFGHSQTNTVIQRAVCKANRKADILTTKTDGYGLSQDRINNQPYIAKE